MAALPPWCWSPGGTFFTRGRRCRAWTCQGWKCPAWIWRGPRNGGRQPSCLLFVMWAVMMVAMMVPSAAPMILAFLSVNQPPANGRPTAGAGRHLSLWIPRGLDRVLRSGHAGPVGVAQAALLSPAMAATSPVFERRAAPRGGRLPMDSAQARVLEGLPVAPLLSYERMARRQRQAPSSWDCGMVPTAWDVAGY